MNRIVRYGVVFCAALACEAAGIVFFLRVDPVTGIHSIRTIGPYVMFVFWAGMKGVQIFAALLWVYHTHTAARIIRHNDNQIST